MTEKELNDLISNNIFCIQDINNAITIASYRISTIMKYHKWNIDHWEDTFACDGLLPDGFHPHRTRITLDMLFLTESDAKVGLTNYINDKLAEIEVIKVKLNKSLTKE